MPTLSRLLTLRILFTYAIPLLHIAYGYACFHRMHTQLAPLGSWLLPGLLTVDIIGLLVAIRWMNNYLGSLYVVLLVLSLSWGLLLAIGEGATPRGSESSSGNIIAGKHIDASKIRLN